MNFIVRAEILNPPTRLLCFRDLCFWLHYDFRQFENILIEVARPEIDIYYKYLKNSPGSMDFVADFIEEDYKEKGLRLADEPVISPTIQAVYINEKNVYSILRAVGYN